MTTRLATDSGKRDRSPFLNADLPSSSNLGPGEPLRVSTEARMQALMEAAVDGIVSINDRGIIQTTNSAAQKLFGYSAAEMVGKNVTLLMPSPYREEHDAYLHRYLSTGERRIIGIGREVVGLRSDGTTFPMDLSVAEARVGEERVFLGVIRDITERKQAEARIQESNASLEKAILELKAKNEEVRAMSQQLWQAAKLASVGELAASIAHELNNPLATVCLRIESVLQRTPPDDPRRRALEIVAQESKRMGDLVANLLQFSRRGEEKISTVNIKEELTNAVELIQHYLRKRQVSVTQEFAENTPNVFADRQKLRQVFLNLLTNAGDAMAKGGELVLKCAPATLASGDHGVQIEFADNGMGIPAHYLEKVQDPFFTTKEEGKGTGLGLAICRRVMQEHRGAIQIESAPGAGTTVRLTLPLRTPTNVSPIRRASE